MIRIRDTAAALLACAALFAGHALAQSPSTHMHSFGGAEHWAKIFDDPARDAWQKPHEVIGALGLKADSVVADIGAGTGYFSVRLAHFVPRGRVYAVDIEPDMVKHLANRAKTEGLKNLFVVRGTPDDARLPEKADVILLVDVYHHVADRVRYFRKLAGSLKPRGRIAVIDFHLDAPEGPPQAARIAPERVRDELRRAGFEPAGEHAFLPNQYFLLFRAGKT